MKKIICKVEYDTENSEIVSKNTFLYTFHKKFFTFHQIRITATQYQGDFLP